MAGGNRNTLLAQNMEALMCKPCGMPFNLDQRKPHVLVGCGHSLCGLCVQALAAKFECPQCAVVSEKPAGGDTPAPLNHAIVAFIAKHVH